MADLENDLLEAAGINKHSLPPSSKNQFFDSGVDDSEDDSDDDASQARHKKRGRDDDDDDDASDDDGGSSDREVDRSDESDVGDDLYKDEDDRKKLSEMTELQREMILSDRAAKKDDKDILSKIASKREKGNVSRRETPPLPSSRMMSSTRSYDRSAAKDGALNELRAKRLKQRDPETQRELKEGSKSAGSGVLSKIGKPNFSSSSHSESESRSRSDEDVEGLSEGEGIIDSNDDKIMPGFEKPSFEDIQDITIPRSKLTKWFMEPFFEELIVGCFVRVGIGRSKTGPIYRLCMVKNVDASDPDRLYKLDNKTTYKYLNVVWGNETSAARWQMAMVSDSPPLEEEFKQWVKEVERSGGRMLKRLDVVEKKQAMLKINNFVYSAATVKQMLEEKKSISRRPLNVAAEKDRLKRELEIAESKNDAAGVEKIQTKLQELEESRKSREKDAKALRLSEMNRKNRVENFKNASDLKPVNKALKAGEAGYDPFSRRWTRSRNYYNSKPAEEATAGNNTSGGAVGDGGSNGIGAGMAATTEALEAAAGAGKLVDTRAPVDEGTESNVLHDFELPISLAMLQKFGGAKGVQAGFMAKKQRIEEVVGFRVPENDGRRHQLTLTVSDYKRRRGLL
ncbi:putative RNA polymerase-associated protein Rtf1 [Medicago truncatula]|uniref:Putative RNA polymerase-associated protein Rtf1 n=1 Tax=Medicago truncatula TaxID=3880 RepID=G7KYI5_MEDTR|nr:protein RTF1 homolog [Medicago truncatula]AES81646.1 RNA polymerase-associated RTF1-like protein [Medicago truncatula]RHN48314.1 putative RNA polymerase-associated protein Rtf1 [Medicago truncatula]